MSKQEELFEGITASIIKSMETVDGSWTAPWHGGHALPENISGTAYRGVNVVALWAAAIDSGYSYNVWGTYKQWAAKKAQVRKGEKGSRVVLWKPIVKHTDEGDKKVLFATSFTVFNAAQVDGWTPAEPAIPRNTQITQDECVSFFAAVGAEVNHGGYSASYYPTLDLIRLPHVAEFESEKGYWAVRSHETVHWSGHSTRCNRQLANRFGSDAYAVEELIAELGAAFLCAHLGISNAPRDDHAKYIKNWLKVLKEDPKAIITAASQAQKAVDFIIKTTTPAEVTINEQEAVSA